MPVWQASAARRISKRRGGAGRFAEPHVEIEQRREPERVEQHAVAGFGRDVAGERVRERIGAQLVERRHRGGADEAVEQHRNAVPARAASVAPRMAASSRPPSAAAMRSGSSSTAA